MKNTWTDNNGYYYVSLDNKSNFDVKTILNRMGDRAEFVHNEKGEVVAVRRNIYHK